jgi:hypothetical protein
MTSARLYLAAPFLVLLSAVAGGTGSASDAAAPKNELTAEIVRGTNSARSGAPMSALWKFKRQRSGLLQGRLELTAFEGEQVFGRFRTEEIVLPSGEQLVETMLPSVKSGSEEIGVHLIFLGKRQRINLGTHTLRVPTPFQRIFVTCVCDPFAAAEDRYRPLVDSLRFERYSPIEADRLVATRSVSVRPSDMPTDPLACCGYDIVLLTNEGFSGLREKQLAALWAWVDAGGRLCIQLQGSHSSVDPHHLNFLEEIGVESGIDLWLRRKGLGRVVIAQSDAAAVKDLTSSQWRTALAFLWNVRADQTPTLVRTGKWEQRLVNNVAQQAGMQDPYPYVSPAQFAPIPIQSGAGLVHQLMPRNVRVISFGLIAAILFLYVVAIGPADYFVLGWFKQRRLTWITFPAVTAGFTLLAVWLSHAYMATGGNRRAAVVLDVGDSGKIVRQSRFELLFSSTPCTMTTELRREVFTPLDHQRFGVASQSLYRGNPSLQSGPMGPPGYDGRVPQRYTVTQHIAQWTPQLNRRFSISPEVDPAGLDWGTTQSITTPQGQQELRQRIMNHFGSDVSIWLFHGESMQHLSPSQTRLPWQYLEGFLQQTSAPRGLGLFGVVSQIAPTGGDNFEDLSLLDPSNPKEWAIVVAVERGEDLLIYRKLYTGEG